MDDLVGYEGIDEAALIHGLYLGTRALGMGVFHDVRHLTIDQVREDLQAMERLGDESIRIDYYRGRPLKVRIDTKSKTFSSRLYDRDAGSGAAARVVERLRVRR